MNRFSEPSTPKKLEYRTTYTFTSTSWLHRIKLAWVIFVGSIWMLRTGEIQAWTEWDTPTDEENARLRAALEPIRRHAQSHDLGAPLRLSVAESREIVRMVDNG